MNSYTYQTSFGLLKVEIEPKIKEQLNKAWKVALWVLANKPDSRDNTEYFIQTCRALNPTIATESYTRIRRWLQNEWKVYPPNEMTRLVRKQSQREYKEYFAQQKTDMKNAWMGQ